MPSAELLVPFFLAAAVFACAPGSGMLYAAAQTLSLGRRAGWLSALGFHIAGLGHVAAAALGVSTLLAAAPGLFTAMKLSGAAYLIWMGVKHLERPRRSVSAVGASTLLTARRALRDGVIVEALNPKSALFHLAFLPQFTDASADLPIWTQIVILGLLVNAMFTMTDAILIETTHALATRLRASTGVVFVLRRLGGGLLVVLGVKLALARPA